MCREGSAMRRVARAGQRLVAADRERAAAMEELTSACAELPRVSVGELARVADLPVAGLIAVRLRLEARASRDGT